MKLGGHTLEATKSTVHSDLILEGQPNLASLMNHSLTDQLVRDLHCIVMEGALAEDK